MRQEPSDLFDLALVAHVDEAGPVLEEGCSHQSAVAELRVRSRAVDFAHQVTSSKGRLLKMLRECNLINEDDYSKTLRAMKMNALA